MFRVNEAFANVQHINTKRSELKDFDLCLIYVEIQNNLRPSYTPFLFSLRVYFIIQCWDYIIDTEIFYILENV